MPYSDPHFYSPLSIEMVKDKRHRALLIHFILSEFFYAMEWDKKDNSQEFIFSTSCTFLPYDWSYEVGCLNKIHEHAKLLPHAFPKLEGAVEAFQETLDELFTKLTKKKKTKEKFSKGELFRELNQLFILLEPFLIACKDNEDLILFILRNSEELSELSHPENVGSLLKKMFPEGFETISHFLRTEYKNRGFESLLDEIDQILSHYEK